MATRKILVSSATGKQESAVIKSLLANPPSFDFDVLTLTLKAASSVAKSLATNSKVSLIEAILVIVRT
ncbi:uncharacterized protein Z518_02064 [Rhinocladiella mackenziei CBS 650.93]|uniref:Uncharacterized protein n=1 Tax=Rhinocladiella mackenziei CBS 650.93 TaxID=1442369 RepID=A0A0D2IW00_9EURO|nr:uncharacterized protein Z518_02064 [Rhinocladiella mackenziei CBS 650.93]KIX07411.1 hypothetical protein Z518_02064 [Rhinocladiella mackenziei CBS 650.93]